MNHKGIDFLWFFSSWYLITCTLHMINDHKRFCWNKCVVMGFFKKNTSQSNSAQIFSNTTCAEGKRSLQNSPRFQPTISFPLVSACAKNTAKAVQIKGRLTNKVNGWFGLGDMSPKVLWWIFEFKKIFL